MGYRSVRALDPKMIPAFAGMTMARFSEIPFRRSREHHFGVPPKSSFRRSRESGNPVSLRFANEPPPDPRVRAEDNGMHRHVQKNEWPKARSQDSVIPAHAGIHFDVHANLDSRPGTANDSLIENTRAFNAPRPDTHRSPPGCSALRRAFRRRSSARSPAPPPDPKYPSPPPCRARSARSSSRTDR